MANTSPIFPQTPKISWATLTSAAPAKDGTTATLVYTAGSNGARVDQIKVRALGTNVQTVLRLFVNNGGASNVAANNSLIHETTINATTLSETTALADNDITIAKGTDIAVPIPYLQAGYKIYAAIGTAVAQGLQVTIHGADY